MKTCIPFEHDNSQVVALDLEATVCAPSLAAQAVTTEMVSSTRVVFDGVLAGISVGQVVGILLYRVSNPNDALWFQMRVTRCEDHCTELSLVESPRYDLYDALEGAAPMLAA